MLAHGHDSPTKAHKNALDGCVLQGHADPQHFAMTLKLGEPMLWLCEILIYYLL